MKRYFAAGFLVASAVLLVIAANPAFTDFATSQFGVVGNKVYITNGATVTNFTFMGTAQWKSNALTAASIATNGNAQFKDVTAQAVAATGNFTLSQNPVAFGVWRENGLGAGLGGWTTNVSDLQATNLTVVNNTTLQNLTVNNTFTVAGKNGLSGTLTPGFLPMAGTATVFSNSIVEQQGTTNIIVRGSARVTSEEASSATSIAFATDTSTTWSLPGKPLNAFRNQATNVAEVTRAGGIVSGRFTRGLFESQWFDIDRESFVSIRDNTKEDGVNRFYLGTYTGTAHGRIEGVTDSSSSTFLMRAPDASGIDLYGDATTTALSLLRAGNAVTLLEPTVANGASAIAYNLDTANTLSTAGAKIASFKNAGAEKASIDKDGVARFDTGVVIATNTTAGVRLDLESGSLAVREGDDSAYAPINTGSATVSGSLQVTNALTAQSLVVSNTASGITPTAAAHFTTKDYTDTLFQTQTWPLASDWLMSAIIPRSDSGTLVTMGDFSPTVIGTGSTAAVANTATRPGHLTQTTGSTIGNIAGWESGVTAWNSARTTIADCTIALNEAVSNRFWFGFFVANAASTMIVDTPDNATAAFRFSPETAGDTSLLTFSQRAPGDTPDTTSTGWSGGGSISNQMMRLRIVITGNTSVKYYTNGVLSYTATSATAFPTNTALLRVMWGVSTRVAATRQVKWWGSTVKQAYP